MNNDWFDPNDPQRGIQNPPPLTRHRRSERHAQNPKADDAPAAPKARAQSAYSDYAPPASAAPAAPSVSPAPADASVAPSAPVAPAAPRRAAARVPAQDGYYPPQTPAQNVYNAPQPPARAYGFDEPYAQEQPEAPDPRRRARRDEDEPYVTARMNRISDLDEPDDDVDEKRGHPVLRVLLVLVVVLALALAAVLLVPSDKNSTGALGVLYAAKTRVKALASDVLGLFSQPRVQPEVTDITVTPSLGTVGGEYQFTITVNTAVEGVCVCDSAGNELTGQVSIVNPDDESRRIYKVTSRVDVPYNGQVFARIKVSGEWRTTDQSVFVSIEKPTPTPTVAPTPTPTPTPSATPSLAPVAAAVQTNTVIPRLTASPTATPTLAPTSTPTLAPTATPTLAPTATPTLAPTATPTLAPTATPTLAPTVAPTLAPTPTPDPTATPMPILTATGGTELKSTETVYVAGKLQKTFAREMPIAMGAPDLYERMGWNGGVLTFRDDNFRRNAAFGTVDMQQNSMSVLWSAEIGSLRTTSSGTVHGAGRNAQPAIVKWSIETRNAMNINDDKKNVSALKEVILAAQDGNVYFLDLADGIPTRDPIKLGYPMNSTVTVNTVGYPLIGFGQSISKVPSQKKTPIGYYLYSLLDQKELMYLNARKNTLQPSQYWTNGVFSGSALFDRLSDNMIVAGENGLLYTVKLNSSFNILHEEGSDIYNGEMTIKPEITYLKVKANAENDNQVGVDGSVAMYDRYVYMADDYGVVRCVDTDTMKTVWSVDTGDNVDATPALSFDGDGSLGLYTGNTCYTRLGSKRDVAIRRLDALTGEEVWKYDIHCAYNKKEINGCLASPVVGQHSISDLVIFTVSGVDDGSKSRVVALDTRTGSMQWTRDIDGLAPSSPVAVYDESGDAKIIQAGKNGVLYLLDARTGTVLSTLDLGEEIIASPAVYKDMLVIGSSDAKGSHIFGIKLQ